MASPKIKHAKMMCITNDSAVRGRLIYYSYLQMINNNIIITVTLVRWIKLTKIIDITQMPSLYKISQYDPTLCHTSHYHQLVAIDNNCHAGRGIGLPEFD